MLSHRVIERITGLLVLAFVVSFIGATVAGAVSIDASRGEIGETLRAIAQNPEAVTHFSLVLAASVFVTLSAAGFYLTFRPHGRNLALLGGSWFFAGGLLAVINDVLTLGLVEIAQDYVAANGNHADAVETLAHSFAATGSVFLNVGRSLIGVGILAFGVLIVRSRAVPRALGWIGIAAGILYQLIWFVGAGNVLGILGLIAHFSLLLLILVLGGWLLVPGTAEANTA